MRTLLAVAILALGVQGCDSKHPETPNEQPQQAAANNSPKGDDRSAALVSRVDSIIVDLERREAEFKRAEAELRERPLVSTLPPINHERRVSEPTSARRALNWCGQLPTRDGGTIVGGPLNGMVIPDRNGGTIVGGPLNGSVIPGMDGGTIVGGLFNGTVMPPFGGGTIVGGPLNGQIVPPGYSPVRILCLALLSE